MITPVDGEETKPWFWPALLGIYALALLVNALILRQAWKENPFAGWPCGDGDVYWSWAQEIAAGKIIGSFPFFSAPLYPYLLGIIRALGGGLMAVYAMQLFAHLLTVLLIGYIGSRRFGSGVGLLAAALFALLMEPAFFAGRVLNCTTQTLLICVLWAVMLTAQRRPSSKWWIAVGITTGLNCLANPTIMAVIPIIAIWAYAQGPRGRRGLRSAALVAGTAMLAISPATIHNFAASREFIPISAQAGLTFYHGNNPRSNGTYSPATGISANRGLQHLDAARVYEKAAGHPGTWRQIDDYFMGRGLAFWRSNAARGVELACLKAYRFLTNRNYDDVYMPTLEVEAGFASRLALVPLRLAWLIPPALVAIAVLAFRPKRYAPELLLFLLPFLTVVIFWFSPRYRFPAAPVIVVLAAWALRQAASWRTKFRWTAAVAAAMVLVVILTVVNHVSGFDAVGPYRAEFHHNLGLVLDREGRIEEAIAAYRESVKLNPNSSSAQSILGDALRRTGAREESLEHLRRAVQLDPANAIRLNSLGIALAEQGSNDEAMTTFAAAVRLAPNVAAYHNSLANILFQKGDVAEAAKEYEAALQDDPSLPQAHLNLGLLYVRQNNNDAALRHFGEAVRFDPRMAEAYHQTALLLLKRKEMKPAVEALRTAHAIDSQNVTYAVALAWALATGPKTVVDADTAITISRQIDQQTGGRNPRMLDTLAAALAAGGQFEEAVRTATTAGELAVEQGDPALAEAILARVKLYEARRPYVDE
jgi:tetratricopeptide (TPR) repeat protein